MTVLIIFVVGDGEKRHRHPRLAVLIICDTLSVDCLRQRWLVVMRRGGIPCWLYMLDCWLFIRGLIRRVASSAWSIDYWWRCLLFWGWWVGAMTPSAVLIVCDSSVDCFFVRVVSIDYLWRCWFVFRVVMGRSSIGILGLQCWLFVTPLVLIVYDSVDWWWWGEVASPVDYIR